jgi:NAD(P)-dependent dehydrogenase (short-subunit alcohol dehydrogenase family)
MFPVDFDFEHAVNVRSTFQIIKGLKDSLSAGRGIVINTISELGLSPQPGLTGYCMQAAGLQSLTQSAAQEMMKLGVKVYCITVPVMYDQNGNKPQR